MSQSELPSLDQATGGLRGLITLISPPQTGATSLSVQLGVDSVRHQDDACCLIISLQLSRWDILTRTRCRFAGIDRTDFMRGSTEAGDTAEAVRPGEMEGILDADNEMKAWGHRVRILDLQGGVSLSIGELKEEAEAFKSETGCQRCLIVIDNIQAWGRLPNRQTKIEPAELLMGLKSMAAADETNTILAVSSAQQYEAIEPMVYSVDHVATLQGSEGFSYAPDTVLLLTPFTIRDLTQTLRSSRAWSGVGRTDEEIAAERHRLAESGQCYLKLQIIKAADGVARADIDLSFLFRQFRFEEVSVY